MIRSGGPVELVYKWLVCWEGTPPDAAAEPAGSADDKRGAALDPDEAPPVERALQQLSQGSYVHSRIGGATGEGQCFAIIPSPAQARYLLPVGNPRCIVNGLSMATPSVRWGRILSSLLSGLVNAGWNGWGREKIVIPEDQLAPLTRLIREITGEAAPVFAVFLGRPGRYRKLTVQAMSRQGNVLGFLKLPLTGMANDRIRHEAQVLDRLRALEGHIPRVLHAGKWREDYVVFQSPCSGRPGPTRFGASHRQFLRRLWEVDGIEKSGQALVAEVRARWEQAAPHLTAEEKRLGEIALAQQAARLSGVPVRCGWMHGDFVASNTVLKPNGELFVVDWELAEFDRPILWDIFNFQAVRGAIRREREFPHGLAEDDSVDRENRKGLVALFLVDSLVLLAQEGRTGRENAMECRCRWLARMI